MKFRLSIFLYLFTLLWAFGQVKNDTTQTKKVYNSKLDIYFISFGSEKKYPNTQYYKDRKSILAMYEEYNAERLPMRISDNGDFEAIVSCEDILDIGLCIPLSSYDTISIESVLRVLDGVSNKKDIRRLDDNAKEKKSGFMFVRVQDLLEKAYYTEPTANDDICCPNEKVYTKEEILRDKFCLALQSPEGILVSAEGSENRNQVMLRTLGLGAKYLDDGEVLQKIEPRQYVTIYEKENLNGEASPIWWLEKKADNLTRLKYPEYSYLARSKYTKFYPVQKYKVIDKKSILEIRFDQEMLANNINFYGNISLAARINNNPIEVSPYSVIGKPQKSYGVNSKPIREIAANFMSLLSKSDQLILNSRSLSIKIRNYENDLEIQRKGTYLIDFKSKLNQIYNQLWFLREKRLISKDSNTPLDLLKNEILKLLSDSQKSRVTKQMNVDSISNIKTRSSTISIALNELGLGEEKLNKVIEDYNQRLIEEKISDLSYEINVVMSYSLSKNNEFDKINPINIGMYKLSNEAGIEAKLNEISEFLKDLNSFSSRNQSIEIEKSKKIDEDYDYISYFDDTRDLNLDYIKFKQRVGLCLNLMEYFNASGLESKEAFLNLSQFSVIEFDRLLLRIKNLIDDLPEDDFLIHLSEYRFRSNIKILLLDFEVLNRLNESIYKSLYPNDSIINEKNYLPELSYGYESDYGNNYKELSYSFLLNKFPDISIKKIAHKVGNYLFSRMLYATIDLGKASVKDNDILEIKVMWYNIDPNTPNAEEGVELSTAKFIIKKTGWHLDATESVLLIDRINQDLVTVDVSPSNFKPTGGASLMWAYYNDYRSENGIQKFARWLEPSFGLNISYLDFDTNETFEIGAGPVVGLWNNRVFLTAGYNFSVAGQSPFYMGIGFSFYNVINKIKGGGKQDNELNE